MLKQVLNKGIIIEAFHSSMRCVFMSKTDPVASLQPAFKVATALCLLGLMMCNQALAQDKEEARFFVASAFVNVHTGPADEYPIFHVIGRGESLVVLKSQTSWYKVQHEIAGGRIIEGWVHEDSLTQTALEDGTMIIASSGSFADYQTRGWEFTLMGGVLDNISAMTASGTWVWTKNLSVDASYTQALGDFSENKIWSVRMRHTIFPQWRISPYLTLGTGEIRTQPRANLVQSGDDIRKSSHYEVGIGVRYYLARSVLIRAEYHSLLALTDRDEQERLDQWMLGASVFF